MMRQVRKKSVVWLLFGLLVINMMPVVPGNVQQVKAAGVGSTGKETEALQTYGVDNTSGLSVKAMNWNNGNTFAGLDNPGYPSSLQDEWAGGRGSYIYMGSYLKSDKEGAAKEPIRWRVLDADSHASQDGKEKHSIFLMADEVLDTVEYDVSGDGADWENSSLRAWLNSRPGTYDGNGFRNSAFTLTERQMLLEAEKEQVSNQTKPCESSGSGYFISNALVKDEVFVLSAEELGSQQYGFASSPYWFSLNGTLGVDMTDYAYSRLIPSLKTVVAANAGKGLYWIRSYREDWKEQTGCVYGKDGMRTAATAYGAGVVPAINLDAEAVLFTTAADWEKPSQVTAVPDTSCREWRTTMKTQQANAQKIELLGEPVIRNGRLYLDYIYTGWNANQLSLMITDNSEEKTILAYGKVADLSSSNSGQERMCVFDLESIPGYTYSAGHCIYIFSECVNRGRDIDTASEMILVNKPGSSEKPVRKPGTGWVRAEDWKYGVDEPQIQYGSDTNKTSEAKVEYKKDGERYFSATMPVEPGHYIVRVTFPATDEYDMVVVEDEFNILEATIAPNAPMANLIVPSSCERVSSVALPIGWKWDAASADVELREGEAVVATAVYDGANKGKYDIESVEVSITRSKKGSNTGNTSGSGGSSGTGNTSGSGDGSGNGNTSGQGDGSGTGNTSGSGDNSGTGNTSGSGDNSGTGNNTSGSGDNSGTGNNTSGSGDNSGTGNTSGSGDNSGTGNTSGSGDGSGTGNTSGSGDGSGTGNIPDQEQNPIKKGWHVKIINQPGSHITRGSVSGEEEQWNVVQEMDKVIFYAAAEYYFPKDYEAPLINGVKVTRTSDWTVVVTGTPTADTEIVLAPAVKVDTTAYHVTVNNGNGDGDYSAGMTVEIQADKKEGLYFEKWKVLKGNVRLLDENALNTYFTMPSGEVIVEACYVDGKTWAQQMAAGNNTPNVMPEYPYAEPNQEDTVFQEEQAVRELAALREKNAFVLNTGMKAAWKKNKLSLTWKKVSGADGYDLFAVAGSRVTDSHFVQSFAADKRKGTISQIAGKKINSKKLYAVKLKAYRMSDTGKEYIGESRTLYTAGGKDKRYTNAKKLKLHKKSYVLKSGGTAVIRADVVKETAGKKLLPKKYGNKFYYLSENSQIAAVDDKGKITAVKKGKCTIYIVAPNGVSAKVKVQVK